MKPNLTRLAWVLSGVAGGTLAATTLAYGCGGDTTVVPGDSGTQDTTVDVTPDAQGVDAHPDVAEAGDVSTSDTMDFTDIGNVEINVPPLADFPHAVDDAYCTRLQQCCGVDPASWNQDGGVGAGCIATFDGLGGAFGIASYGEALDSGLVGYNMTLAATCIKEWLSFNCGTVSVNGLNTAKADCFGAMPGTLAANAGPCVNSLECKSGEYCVKAADAGMGTCIVLQTFGQPCSDFKTSTDCTYLGNGTPPLYCDADSGTCQNALPTGSVCKHNQQCQTNNCFSPSCIDTFQFSTPGTGLCDLFTIKDAGGGG
jgi:hypothetical protein